MDLWRMTQGIVGLREDHSLGGGIRWCRVADAALSEGPTA